MVENAALTEMPSDELLEQRIDRYLDEHWEDIVADIDRLVRIPSFEDLDAAAEGAPYGPGPRKALDAALAMARDMGFEVHDDAGHVGYADLVGASEEQLGIIGHIDVVPAGPGWHFEPYQVTRKDGYLLGRGVIDDKGPSVVALHAMNLWRRMQLDGQAPQLPYTLRFIFGVNEETRMDDVHYYRAHHADPAFLFTPDAEFPVCYGEKGGYDGELISKPIADRIVLEFTGGAATNAVPGIAEAVVKADAADLPNTDRITVAADGEGRAKITAAGKGAHASMPEGGVNAIGLIVDYLLEHDLCTADERAFFELDQKLLNHTDGSGIGIKSSDEYFGPLTVIGGTIKIEDDRFVQTLDSRFPTSITADEITERLVQAIDSQIWGQGFDAPVFANEFRVVRQSLVKDAHTKLILELGGQRFDAIFFRHTETLPGMVRLAYRPNINEFMGRRSVQLVIEAAEL